MNKVEKRILRAIKQNIDITGKSRRWVISTMINNGEYSRLLKGEIIAKYQQ